MFIKIQFVIVITIAFFLASLRPTSSQIISQQKFPYASHGVKRIDDPRIFGELKLTDPKKELFFEQILDHFDYNNNKTFKQVS